MKFNFDVKRFKKNFIRDWQLHVLMLFPLVYLTIFNIIPLHGLQLAFRDYTILNGVGGSKWIGLKLFERFLNNPDFGLYFKNTLYLSLYSMVTFPLPVVFALILNALRSEKYKKVVQTVSYMPYFLSTTVMVGILHMVLNPLGGMYGNLYQLITGARATVDIRYMSSAFRHLYVWSGVWQSLGWSSIIYMAALSSVSQELHEAAQIDGATRLKRMWHVDLPAIMPTVAIMFIMRCTSIISVGAEKVLLMQKKGVNTDTAEVLSTKVLNDFRDKGAISYSEGTAIGLFNTAINLFLLVLVNTIVKKATDGEVTLY